MRVEKSNIEELIAYMVQLVPLDSIRQAGKVDYQVTASQNIKSVHVDLAGALFFLISELVANSLLHGYPEVGDPKITVSLTLDEAKKEYTLVVKDNGTGFPRELFDAKVIESLGLYYVKLYGKAELGGTTQLETSSDGTVWTFVFPVGYRRELR